MQLNAKCCSLSLSIDRSLSRSLRLALFFPKPTTVISQPSNSLGLDLLFFACAYTCTCCGHMHRLNHVCVDYPLYCWGLLKAECTAQQCVVCVRVAGGLPEQVSPGLILHGSSVLKILLSVSLSLSFSRGRYSSLWFCLAPMLIRTHCSFVVNCAYAVIASSSVDLEGSVP